MLHNTQSNSPLSEYKRIIMGVDPGTSVMGYALLGIKEKTPEVIVCGVIELSKYETHYKRLRRIFERITSLIEQYLPDEMAIEAPFFGKNVQSMLKLGRAQGVAMAAALVRDIPIAEYAPLSIKQAVTGSGSASKERVAVMLQNILKIPADKMPHYLDATDALGAALTHFYETTRKIPASKGGRKSLHPGGSPRAAKSWEDFLKANPERIANPKSKKDKI